MLARIARVSAIRCLDHKREIYVDLLDQKAPQIKSLFRILHILLVPQSKMRRRILHLVKAVLIVDKNFAHQVREQVLVSAMELYISLHVEFILAELRECSEV